ncbi:S8 family peptidase [Piscinibacter sp. XHJ-5]|uniref:S8 family peptidase n=1 Tax=Piscinibacter sp. XHJ-5 TaxID=3037797 RepID=UPI00245309EA|nr:S8 family peptidase [Piscinibacter sp. XHJ-5]
MRHPLLTLAMLCALLAPMTLHAPHAQAAKRYDDAASDRGDMARVIVKYKAGSPLRGQAAALSQRLGVALTDGHAIGERAQVVFARGLSSRALAARLAADSEVEFAEPDRRRFARAVPNDPLYPGNQPSGTTPTVGQWYLRPPTSTNVSAINAETAWNTTTGSSSVTVAVLDTGVRFDHPDLAGKLHPGYDFINDVKTANDGTGRDGDPSDPGDWVTQAEVNSDPDFADCSDAVGSSSWHGTQVAGLIGAATNNGIGMASVGYNVMVLPVRVLGKCGGFDSDIQAAMLWAAGLSSNPVANPHPAQILNLSLGSPGACPASYQSVINQLNAAGVTVVVSAGNDSGAAVDAPANCSGAIAVGAVRHIGTKVGFSSVGPQVALSAPGGNCVNETGACLNMLVTTVNTGATGPATNTYTDSFEFSVGTSFSAPLVAGTAALMLSANPAMTPTQIRNALVRTARPFPASSTNPSVPVCHAPDGNDQIECHCTSTTCGAGMLDAAGAVVAANLPTAVLNPASASVASGQAVTLSAAGSEASAGRAIVQYQWAITSGDTSAVIESAAGDTATLRGTAPGTVVVSLTVTDSGGGSATSSSSVVVTAAPAQSGGGGGGAVDLSWLVALALAIAWLRVGRQATRV